MLRFAAIADVQYGDCDDRFGRHFRASLEKLIAASGAFAQDNIIFAMNFGDIIQENWRNILSIKEVLDVSQKQGGVIWRHILGNHDFLVSDDKKSDVYTILGLEKLGYYDFSLVDPEDSSNKWRLVALNGNEISTYAAESNDERLFAEKERMKNKLADGSLPHDYNGSISEEQLQWLDTCLQEAETAEENVLVCSHFPLFAQSKSFHSRRTKLASLVNVGIYYSELGVSTWNGRRILEILDNHSCVKGFLAGHLHEGSYGVRRNVAHITFNGVVETTTNAYSFVNLHKDSIVVDGREEQPSYKFNFN